MAIPPSTSLLEVQPVCPGPAGSAALCHTRFALSWWEGFKACLRREVILMQRNSFLYAFRLGQVGLHALDSERLVGRGWEVFGGVVARKPPFPSFGHLAWLA